MNDPIPSLQKQEREKALAQDRKKILNLTPEKALEAIAEHPYPVTLLQSMAEEDFYFLVHHIGPDDALPVIALASNEQWDYLIDMEVWEQDQLSSHLMTQWFNRLKKADSDRFTHWITNEKQEDMALYLFRNIELHIREYEEDPGEIDDSFFSEDQTYYIRMRPYPRPDKKRQEERDLFIKDLLNRLSVYDFTLYRDLLLASDTIVPAETEEELYRKRKVRMAEKGLLPFEEAIGVYQPLKASDLLKRSPKTNVFEGRIVDAYPLPIDPEQPPEDANLFTRTLMQINDGPALRRLQAEFAGLCNQVICADKERIKVKHALTRIVKKVGDYISIGLEKTAVETAQETPHIHARFVQDYFLADIFRVGYGCALALKWKIDKWRHASWFADKGLPLSFWGETLMGVLGGVLIKKPLYFDNYSTGVLYREFACMEDIEKTETQLDHVIAFDDLLSMMDIEPSPAQGEILITYENLLLTLWANHHLNMNVKSQFPQPLSMEQFGRIFEELWQPETQPRKISNAVREIFLGWLSDRSQLAVYDISQRMAEALEKIFIRIEEELGGVDQKDLDPRFITLFLCIQGQAS